MTGVGGAPVMFTRLTGVAVTNPTRSHQGPHKGDRQAAIKIDGHLKIAINQGMPSSVAPFL